MGERTLGHRRTHMSQSQALEAKRKEDLEDSEAEQDDEVHTRAEEVPQQRANSWRW